MDDPINYGQALNNYFGVRLDCLSRSQLMDLTDGIIKNLLNDLYLIFGGLLQLV